MQLVLFQYLLFDFMLNHEWLQQHLEVYDEQYYSRVLICSNFSIREKLPNTKVLMAWLSGIIAFF